MGGTRSEERAAAIEDKTPISTANKGGAITVQSDAAEVEAPSSPKGVDDAAAIEPEKPSDETADTVPASSSSKDNSRNNSGDATAPAQEQQSEV